MTTNPNLVTRKVLFFVIVCAFVLTVSGVPGVLCYPPLSVDYMPSTTATMELEITGLFNETLVLNGPTTVARGMPYDPGDGHVSVDTQILNMNLAGSSAHLGPMTIIQSPSKTSNGTIRQISPGVDFPASSSFDVFVEIQTTLAFPFRTFHNDDPVFMNANVASIPPWGSNYTGPPAPVPLKDDQGNVIGFIVRVSHVIGPASSPVGGFTLADYSVHAGRLSVSVLYISLVSMIIVVTTTTVIYVKHGKHKKGLH